MKKHLLSITATLSLCLMLGAAAAAQTTRQMTVTIPFAFSVGKTALPAGTYTVYRMSINSGDRFLLRGADGREKVVFNAQEIQSGELRAIGRVEFRRYGDHYFLARVWTDGSNIGRELQPSSLERDTAKAATRRLAQNSVQPAVVTASTQ